MKESLLHEFSKSREGKRLLTLAKDQEIAIKIDPQLGLAHPAIFMPQRHLITLSAHLERDTAIVCLAHELRHAQQRAAGLISPPVEIDSPNLLAGLLHPLRYMIMGRMAEADAMTFQTLFAFAHARESGNNGVAAAARKWGFLCNPAPEKPPAGHAVDFALSFIDSKMQWNVYKDIYAFDLNNAHDLCQVLPKEFKIASDNRPGASPDDIRKFSSLETSLNGVQHYLQGASDHWLIANGFLSLPDHRDPKILKVIESFERLTAKAPATNKPKSQTP